ncbi:MAG: Gfo/Idh/MocA family oxidoreductase [Gorillibacterium sp.]|nr:Gfo/Idh/MocA family oxidoreductase [Gorillibacterium sp.]
MTIKYKVAVAGCGSMAHTWVEYAQKRPDIEIVALIDIHLATAQAMAAKHELTCLTCTSLEEALQQTEVNLVFDVTVPASHHAISTAAMQAGCDVFAEKPLANSMDECNDIVRVMELTGQVHSVMQNRRFDPRMRSLRKLIDTGTIGKPGYAGADFFLGPHFGGFRDVMDSPLLLDMAIHTFDQARMILNADPVSVYCHEFSPAGSWYAGNASAICIFEMSNGSVFCYRGSWCAEGVPTPWEGEWRITGEQGTAIWDGKGFPYAEVVSTGDQTGKFFYDYTRVEGEALELSSTYHHGCLDEMFTALEEQRPAETDCRDNRFSMAMVFAAVESARTAAKVNIAEFIGF